MFFRRNTSSADVSPVSVPQVIPPVMASPVSAPPATALRPEAGATAAPGKKILIVDDDQVILKTLSFKLKSKGYRVIVARDGSQALGAMRDEEPDLLLVDVCFPPDVTSGGCVAWDGFLLVQWIRRMAGKVPAILMSSADPAGNAARASAAGATGFLRKPINTEQLFSSVDAALCGAEMTCP